MLEVSDQSRLPTLRITATDRANAPPLSFNPQTTSLRLVNVTCTLFRLTLGLQATVHSCVSRRRANSPSSLEAKKGLRRNDTYTFIYTTFLLAPTRSNLLADLQYLGDWRLLSVSTSLPAIACWTSCSTHPSLIRPSHYTVVLSWSFRIRCVGFLFLLLPRTLLFARQHAVCLVWRSLRALV